MRAALYLDELLTWIGGETGRYERWFAVQPAEVWSIPVGAGRIATIHDLLHHVFTVDLRLAQRVHRAPVSADAEVAAADPAALFALARRGQSQLRAALASYEDLDEVISWQGQAGGQIRASKRKVIAHSLTHHLRHMAQAATLLRLHGHPTDWLHDLLVSDALA